MFATMRTMIPKMGGFNCEAPTPSDIICHFAFKATGDHCSTRARRLVSSGRPRSPVLRQENGWRSFPLVGRQRGARFDEEKFQGDERRYRGHDPRPQPPPRHARAHRQQVQSHDRCRRQVPPPGAAPSSIRAWLHSSGGCPPKPSLEGPGGVRFSPGPDFTPLSDRYWACQSPSTAAPPGPRHGRVRTAAGTFRGASAPPPVSGRR